MNVSFLCAKATRWSSPFNAYMKTKIVTFLALFLCFLATFPAEPAFAADPVVSDIPNQTIAEGETFATINLDDYVTDADHPDAEISWTYSGNIELTVSIDVDRVATITVPNENWSGAETITFTATDPGSLFAQDAATFTVTAVNDPPVVSDIPDQTIDEGQTFTSITLDNFVADVETPDAQIVWTASGNVELGVSIVARVATITVPNENWSGAETITFTATDPGSLFAQDAATFTVTAVNDPPVVSDIPDQTIDEGQTFTSITLDNFVADVETPDAQIVWTASGNVELGVSIVARVATITVPNENWSGAETITFTATDPGSLFAQDAATFTVTAVNDPPVVSDIPDQTIDEGQTFTTITLDNFVADVETPDAQIVWTASGNVELGVSIVARVATITVPNENWSGAETITFTATDPGSLFAQDAATFTVTAVNDPPVVSDIPDQTIDEGQTFTTIHLDDYVTDADNLDSEINWTYSGNTELTVSIDANRVATITIPDPDWNGAETITFTATDPGSLFAQDAATFTVTAVNDPPVANDDAYTTDEDTDLTVDAPGVLGNDTDPDDGDLLTATLDSGPSNGTLTLNSDGSFTYKPNLNFNGTDSFTYRANDGTSDSDDVATVTITVNSVVDPPIADAGPDQTVRENTVVTLGGSNSFDTEGETLSYQWDQLAGPSVTLSSPQAANPTFTAPGGVGSGGELLTFQLTVTDEEAAQATDTAIVNVTLPLPLANSPPIADAGTDQNIEEGETVTLKGSNSFDPDGDNVSYQWDQIAGPPVSLSDPRADNPTFTAPFVALAGLSFTFELTVTDTSGLRATDTTIVNVTSSKISQSPNQPPEAVGKNDPQIVAEEDQVTLIVFKSSDPEGDNLFYRWRQVAGRPVTLSDPTAEQPTFTAPNVGDVGVSLIFELTVTDVGKLQAVASAFVNVQGTDELPTADAGDIQTAWENNTVTLDGSASSDPEGQNISYRWRQTAGPSVTINDPAAAQTTFTAPNVTPNGVFLTFRLTVIDVVEQQDFAETVVNVEGNNDLPTADAGDDQTVLEKSTVMLDASNSSDPDVDDSMIYQWNQTGGKAVALSDPTSKLPTFEAPAFEDADGQPLIFELIVTDGQGEQSQEDSTTVTVSNFEKKNPGASGGGCFIATTAYGSSMDSHANLLIEFRDRFLLTNPVGEEFLKLYYTYSYPVADIVAKHETLHKLARCSLLLFTAMVCLILAMLLTNVITARKRQRRRSFVP